MRSYNSSLIDNLLKLFMWLAFVIFFIVCSFALFELATCKAKAGEAPKVYPGPYVAYVDDDGVYDGDTINVEIHTAPGQILMTGLRVAGVDTPELTRSGCITPRKVALELKLGAKAKAFVKERYPDGLQIQIRNLKIDKFGGRHVAIVERKTITGWVKLDDELLRTRPRIADPYGYRKSGPKKDRLKKTKSWCEGQ